MSKIARERSISISNKQSTYSGTSTLRNLQKNDKKTGADRITLSGEELKESCENELKQRNIHHLIIVLAN